MAPDSQPSQRMFLWLPVPPRPLPQLPQVINYRNVGLCVAVVTVDLSTPLSARPEQPAEGRKVETKEEEIDFPPLSRLVALTKPVVALKDPFSHIV